MGNLVHLDGDGLTGKRFEVKVARDKTVITTKGFNTLEEAERYAKEDVAGYPLVIVDTVDREIDSVRGKLDRFKTVLDPEMMDDENIESTAA